MVSLTIIAVYDLAMPLTHNLSWLQYIIVYRKIGIYTCIPFITTKFFIYKSNHQKRKLQAVLHLTFTTRNIDFHKLSRVRKNPELVGRNARESCRKPLVGVCGAIHLADPDALDKVTAELLESAGKKQEYISCGQWPLW